MNERNPEEWKQLISLYLDGETTAEESRIVEEALIQDASLKKYYEDLRKVSSSLQSWKDETLSPDLEQKIRRQTGQKREGFAMKNFKNWVPVLTGLSVFIMVLSFQMYMKRSIQWRLRTAADTFEDDPWVSKRIQDYLTQETKGLGTTGQYEPYYSRSEYSSKSTQRPLTAADDMSDQYSLPSTARKMVTIARSDKKENYAASMPEIAYRQRELRFAQKDENKVMEEEYWGQPAAPMIEGAYHTEEYDRIYENQFLEAIGNPLSTFSIDVDTASYSNVRRFLNQGQMPPADAVRIEEMINYFSYDYPQPSGRDPVSITTEMGECPWNRDHHLLLVGLQAKELRSREIPPSNLVFLIDVSGSMADANKLPLLKESFKFLVRQLRREETISIVTYAGNSQVVLDSVAGYEKERILDAIDRLQSGGSTAGAAGIQTAYDLARRNFIRGGNNRVILATDGDFNVGVSSDGELVRMIEEKRKDGIFLSVLGFGTGNYKDSKMEKIADSGNGTYYYIDSIQEGEKVLGQELGSTLFTVAKDVKIQIEFNPRYIKAYRLIGYENRVLAKEDFNDDAKDAGEMGAGHTVTALYEIIPEDSREKLVEDRRVDPLKYMKQVVNTSRDLLTVKLRYKEPDGWTSQLIEKSIRPEDVEKGRLSENLNFASAVAEFGLLLQESQFKGQSSYREVIRRAENVLYHGQRDQHREEFVNLVEQAMRLDQKWRSPAQYDEPRNWPLEPPYSDQQRGEEGYRQK